MSKLIKCPYDALTVKLSVMGANRKLEEWFKKNGGEEVAAPKFEAMIQEKISQYPPLEGESLNTNAAKFHGISVIDLINSPNMEVLQAKYAQSVINEIVDWFCKEFEVEPAAAWYMMFSEDFDKVRF